MYQTQPTLKGQFEKLFYFFIFFTASIAIAQSKTQVQKITSQYSSSKLGSLTTKLKNDFDAKRPQILQLAKRSGWKISDTLANGNSIELHDIGADGMPLYYTTYNDEVSHVSRASTLYSNGLLDLGIDGEGMHVGVWDEGIARMTHQEFDTRITSTDNTENITSHATRVMGTLIASGLKRKAKGVAYKAKATTNNWVRDRIEVAEAAANGLLLSNHSYGLHTANIPDWYFGSYIRVSQQWDDIMYNAPYYLMVTAAGNSQRLRDNASPISGTVTDGFDLILGFTAAKNGITVAAADADIDNYGDLKNANVTRYSSFGPVDDGRIKPDLASNGSDIYSTSYKDDKSYDTSSGTSMATPGVTGSLLLLQQYYERLYNTYMKAATVKGLALHTADDVNEPGPDYTMGWGVMNAKKAAEAIVNNQYNSLLLEEILVAGESYTITVNANEKEALMASISWTDPASGFINSGNLNDTTPALVNDLDIRITKNEETYYPWKLSAAQAAAPAKKGDNLVDPFEKVDIDNASGSYTITVTHKGSLLEGQQNFSLIVSGIAYNQCVVEIPSEITVKEASDATLTLAWKALPDALFELSYRAESTEEWITSTTATNSLVLENLVHEIKYEFKLRTLCTENITSDYSSEQGFVFKGLVTAMNEILVYETLGIPEEMHFSIYPNPSTNFINLDGKVSNTAKYRIISISGTVVKEGDASGAQIGVSNLSSGMYILKVQDLEGYTSLKFYKD